jgi:hypothetical protein
VYVAGFLSGSLHSVQQGVSIAACLRDMTFVSADVEHGTSPHSRKGREMAQKKAAKPRKRGKFAPDNPNFNLKFGPLTEDCYLFHGLIFDNDGNQLSCSYTACPIPGSSDMDLAFNLKKGFKYQVIHRVVKKKKKVHCRWTVIQLPYKKNGGLAVKHEHCTGGGGSVVCNGPNYCCSNTCNMLGCISDCTTKQCQQPPNPPMKSGHRRTKKR